MFTNFAGSSNFYIADFHDGINVETYGCAGCRNRPKPHKAADFDFRLKPTSAAVDRGVILPNVNDDFTGRAPDLGALEVGKPSPHYGPRP